MVQATDILLNLALFLIMFTVGLTLSAKEIKNIFRYPKKLFVGLSSQMILIPITAFLILLLFNLPEEIKMGIIILALCPGGATSNFISYLVKADTHLSVSLTTVNTLLSMISIPILVNFFLNFYLKSPQQELHLPFLRTVLNLAIIIIIPIALGIFIKNKSPKKSIPFEKIAKITGVSLLIIIFAIKIFLGSGENPGLNLQTIFQILPVLILIHFASLFTGFFNSRLFKINLESAITTGIETGLQNTGLALLIASSILKNNLMTQPILVYAMFSFFTTLLFGVMMKKALLKEGLRKKIKITLNEKN